MKLVLPPTRRRDDAPFDADEELSQEADHEDRDGDENEAEQQDGAVEESALTQAGDEAEADTEDGLDDQCHEGKFHRDRKCLCQNFTDRSSGETTCRSPA